jgi:hypothetical protein
VLRLAIHSSFHSVYSLACICCALGRVEEARQSLARAVEIGDKELKLRALEDEELAAIW